MDWNSNKNVLFQQNNLNKTNAMPYMSQLPKHDKSFF